LSLYRKLGDTCLGLEAKLGDDWDNEGDDPLYSLLFLIFVHEFFVVAFSLCPLLVEYRKTISR
ncbi:MAG: hypothetical protein KJ578_15880, partial [Bacteroidetes bacterium]|nr:hypothetical protein [Bacteroidota bacterium]